jgi:GTP-binding protein LepA
MSYRLPPTTYHLNLIDTPGHVDFTYEVSRSLAAVEGAILLVDASQGIQAQTIANLTLAIAQGLTIVPAVNKVDLPNVAVEEAVRSVARLIGCAEGEVLRVSGKTGVGVEALLEEVVRRVPPPKGSGDNPLAALIFDSQYDTYRGVVAYVRVMEGSVKKGDTVTLMGTGSTTEALEVGSLSPGFIPAQGLTSGEIGYIVTGLKEVRQCRVGDTVTSPARKALHPLPGYREVRPYVFAGLFAKDGEAEELRDAIEKLQLNDASLTYVPQRSTALGFGFRCGFLGLLHLEIVLERLRREYNLEIIATVPNVEYRVLTTQTSVDAAPPTDRRGYVASEELHAIGALEVKMPQEFPDPSRIQKVFEPWVHLTVITPSSYIGNLIQFMQGLRGIAGNTEYLADGKAMLHYDLPLSSIIVNFYDNLQGASQGYASMDYEMAGFREADIIKLDILIAEISAPELSVLIEESEALRRARSMVELLKELIPRQMFAVKIQAAIGAKIVASETLSAMRKDVTAKLSGGDVTRRRKLLEKQKKGKKRMAQFGSVEIPPDAYRKLLQRS